MSSTMLGGYSRKKTERGRMNWKSETRGEYEARLSQYRRWFAWYPVYTEGRYYWLETVLRRYDFSYSSFDGYEKEAVYKPLED